MNRVFYLFFAAVFSLLTVMAFSACGEDDKDEQGSVITGKWVNEDADENTGDFYRAYVMNSDGTCYFECIHGEKDGWNMGHRFSGTFVINGDVATLTLNRTVNVEYHNGEITIQAGSEEGEMEDMVVSSRFKVEGEKLTIYEDGIMGYSGEGMAPTRVYVKQ